MDSFRISLRVLTLNCWAIAIKGFETKLRKERIDAIAEHLRGAAYDIVVLQEIWSQDDYSRLWLSLQEILPFSHYFYSGFIGSGICVFSKYPILQTLWHAYPMSGYAYKIQHGDWYGASGAGLCKVQVEQATVHLYATHIHARYSFDELEEYWAHRATQMLNLAQFVRLTSDVCDAVLLCGDLNTEDHELGYRLLRDLAELKDAWLEQNTNSGGVKIGTGSTCDKPDNPFADKKVLKYRPSGQRIDYIMYRQNSGTELACAKCLVTMGQIPNRSYYYSDHEAVLAYFTLEKGTHVSRQPTISCAEQVGGLEQVALLLDDALHRCRRRRLRHAAFALAWFAIMILLAWVPPPLVGAGSVCHAVRELLQAAAAVTAAACAWSSAVLLRIDLSSLQQHKRDAANLLCAVNGPVEKTSRERTLPSHIM